MSIFDGKRLPIETFQIDVARVREGWYTDAYFSNTVKILTTLAEEGYTFNGISDIKEIDSSVVENGNLIVEMQFFNRRKPFSLVAGVDEALALLQTCTGHYNEEGQFVNTYSDLEIEAVHDGTFVYSEGDPSEVQPVLKVRGRYRDFAQLETPILGVLTEATRVATNVYNVLLAAGGKDVLFFPARFAHYKLQALHGYAYSLAVQAFNHKYGNDSRAIVSTNEQGLWWGGTGGGTIAHASIACFFGDTTETMMQFARIMPMGLPRIALVDFHNDCVGETLKIMKKMFKVYWNLYKSGNKEEAQRYKLSAVRLDTSSNMRDSSIEPVGDTKLDNGVNPRLVRNVRNAIDTAYIEWGIPDEALSVAREWCKDVKIVATGGFSVEKIKYFEELKVPVDIYGVGSSLLENSRATGASNDYTADIVRVLVNGEWQTMCKSGRQPCNNPSLKPLK